MRGGVKNDSKKSDIIYEWSLTQPTLKCYFFFLGAIKTDYTEKDVCIGNYPLSAALTCAKVCSAFEEAWGIF